MTGYLLARAGVEVVVLEKHADFFRDFRGDTIHPSTLELVYELGLLSEFLARPHQEARHLSGMIGDERITMADFTHLPTHCRFIALMPQWDFLDLIAEHAKRYRSFELRMESEVTGLVVKDEGIAGIRAQSRSGPLTVMADLTVGADGRHSTVRRHADLSGENLGAPIDVLWTRLTRRPSDGSEPLGRIGAGRIFVMIDRGDYWQCALVIRKGGFDEVKRQGLDALRAAIAAVAPNMKDRLSEIRSWDDVK